MAKIHTVAETTNVRAVHYAERIWDAVSVEDIDNGTFGYLNGVETEGGVIYNFEKGTKDGAPVVMSHNPEWTEDTSNRLNQRKDKFFVPAGVPFRAFTLHEGDEIALSAEGFEGTPEIDKYVSINADGKLAVADAPVEGAAMVGKIMRKRQIGSTLVTGARTYGYSRMMYTVKVESLA
jgi:hypothetical protein